MTKTQKYSKRYEHAGNWDKTCESLNMNANLLDFEAKINFKPGEN